MKKGKKQLMTPDERMSLKEAIMDAHLAADKYLASGKEVHVKLLELSVADAMDYVELLSDKLRDDPKSENYKLHMLVPLQLSILIEERKEKDAKKALT